MYIQMSRLPRYLALQWEGMSSSVQIRKMMYMLIWKHGHKEVDFYLLQMVNLHVLDGTSRLYLHKQQNRYGLRGYVSAYILPDGFVPLCPGVEIASQKETEYASITIRNPFKEHLNIFLMPIRRSWSILMPMDADRISVMNMYAAFSMYTRKMI